MGHPSYRALLIGNSRFPDDRQNLQPLEGPVNDVALLRDALADPQVGLFDPQRVRILPERTSQEILMEVEQFFESVTRAEHLLFYYSGHGLLSVQNKLFLCARDTRTDRLQSTAVSSDVINAVIDASGATTTIIILDCCHSGAFKGGSLPDTLKGSGRFLLTSCRTGELANDANEINHASVFTHHLIEGLRGGARDHNGNGYIDLNEIYDYVHGRLSALGKQIPQRRFSGGGDVEIARRRVSLDPAKPGTVDDAIAGGPVLDLSQTVIDLRDVSPEEELPPERIYVRNVAGGPIAWSVETTAGWVNLDRAEESFTVALHPRLGMNRANILVREESTGATKVVRVNVQVVGNEPDANPVPPSRARFAVEWNPGDGDALKRTLTRWRRPLGVLGLLTGVFALLTWLPLFWDSRGSTPPSHIPPGSSETTTAKVPPSSAPGVPQTFPPAVVVPHVYGIPESDGEAQLINAGFAVQSERVCSSSVGLGQIRQVRSGNDTVVDDKSVVATDERTLPRGSVLFVKVGNGTPCP